MRNILVIAAFTICAIGNAHPGNEGQNAKVINVIDGNTLEVMFEDKEVVRIMFNDVDSPELEQEFGAEAKEFTEKLLLKKKVYVEMMGKDRWGNRLANVSFTNGKNVDIEIVEAGLAWKGMKSKDSTLAQIEAQSKKQKIGLWASEEPTPPWIWRRQQTMLVAKSQ